MAEIIAGKKSNILHIDETPRRKRTMNKVIVEPNPIQPV